MANAIRVRAGIIVIQEGKILLVPHYNIDAAPVQWYLPGGGVEFGETVKDAAVREFFEETGLRVRVEHLLDVNEVIHHEKPYHSLTIIFTGSIIAGTLTAETQNPYARYGDKMPQWFSWEKLQYASYHPKQIIENAFTNDPQQSPPLQAS